MTATSRSDFYIAPELVREIDECLRQAPLPRIETQCRRCGNSVCFPLVAREREIKILQAMVVAAQRFCEDAGITAKMMASIHAQIATGRAFNKVRDTNGHQDHDL